MKQVCKKQEYFNVNPRALLAHNLYTICSTIIEASSNVCAGDRTIGVRRCQEHWRSPAPLERGVQLASPTDSRVAQAEGVGGPRRKCRWLGWLNGEPMPVCSCKCSFT